VFTKLGNTVVPPDAVPVKMLHPVVPLLDIVIEEWSNMLLNSDPVLLAKEHSPIIVELYALQLLSWFRICVAAGATLWLTIQFPNPIFEWIKCKCWSIQRVGKKIIFDDSMASKENEIVEKN
jgi:hypothetical protein